MDPFLVVLSILLISILKTLHNYFSNVFNYWKSRGINGPVPIPFFGNSLSMLFQPLNELEKQRMLKYGRVHGTFEFSNPVLTVTDPALIREVTIKQFHKFQSRCNKFSNNVMYTKTLLFSSGETWKRLRNSMSPMFTTKVTKSMFPEVEECAENTLQYIRSVENKEVDLKITSLSYTMDVIAKCIFGINTNGYKDPNAEFLVLAHKFQDISLSRVFISMMIPKKIQNLHKFFQISAANENVIEYFREFITSIIDDRKNKNIKQNDFLTYMLDLEETEIDKNANYSSINASNEPKIDGNEEKFEKKMTMEEILAQSFIMFISGYETTSTLVSFTLYSLAVNPEIQERLHEEIMKVCRENAKINAETIYLMSYLDSVVNESLRMYPPVVELDRIADEDVVLGEQKIKIDKGTIINLPYYAVHHNPELFPEPDKFKPERFFPENKHLIEPYSFIPFGSGPRNCIGLRFALLTAKTFIFKLVKDFKIIKTENTAIDLKYKIVLESLATQPLIVAFQSRK